MFTLEDIEDAIYLLIDDLSSMFNREGATVSILSSEETYSLKTEELMSDSSKVINVSIAFLNVEATEAIKQYATDKVQHCVRKFAHQDTEAHIVLKVEKMRQIAEVSMHLSGADFIAKEESDSLYSSIDKLTDSLSQQLRKHKEKVTKHH